MSATFHGAGRSPSGARYRDQVPDTLDLAERARLGVNYLTETILPEHGHEMYFGAFLDPDHPRFHIEQRRRDGATLLRPGPPSPFMHCTSLGSCQQKAVETLAFMRIMTGSRQHLDREAAMMQMMDSMFAEDGLQWVSSNPVIKPWIFLDEPFVMIHGQGRMLRAIAAWWQYTTDRHWVARGDALVEGLWNLAVHRGDLAFIPTRGAIDIDYWNSCYTRSGWSSVDEPSTEKSGEEGSLFNHQGHLPGALATWAALTGNERALELSGKLVRFLTQRKFWADFGTDLATVDGAAHAHFEGHFHGHINTLRAILEYALVTGDARLLQFARDGYEWARQAMVPRIGFVGDGQGCGTARMIGLAVKLTEAGIGDYWEDVDQYVRNFGVELQFTHDDVPRLRALMGSSVDEAGGTRLLTDVIGAFASTVAKNRFALCCGTHGNMGLFYAWDAAVRRSAGVVTVNLLLNRSSAWLDVKSYLPLAGRVSVEIKDDFELHVRVPLAVSRDTVRWTRNGQTCPAVWAGRYLRLGRVVPGDVVEVAFPISETVEEWNVPRIPLPTDRTPAPTEPVATRLHFRGNTLIEMDPPIPGSPVFAGRRRELDERGPSAVRQVDRFVWSGDLRW